MKLTRIHVNQHIIKRNRTTGETTAPLTVKVGRKNFRAHQVEVDGPSTVVYRPDRPLSCGARVWIETRSSVRVCADGTWTDVEVDA